MTSKKLQTLSHHFRMLWSLLGWRLPLMLILTALGTLIDGVGLALFLPLFGLFQGAPNPQPDKVLDFVTQLMHFLGVPVEMGSILVLIVAVFFIKGAIKFAESAYMGYMKSLVPMQLQSRFIHAFFRAKHSYSVGLDSGSLVHLSGGEISLAVVSLFQGVAAVAMLCSLLAYTGITTAVDYRFTLAAAFAGVLPILVFRLIQTKTKKASRRLSVSRVELQGRATELLQNGKYLKATGNSEKLLPLFEAELAGVGQNIRQVEWLVAWTKGVREPLLVAVAGVMVFVWRIWHPSIEGMVFIFLLLYRALTNLMGFQVAWQGFLSSSGAIDIVLQHIADLETHAAHCGNQAPQSGVPTICFRGVGVNFGDRPALSGIHLDIQPNEFIVLLGPSGAGKSTFVNLLTGLIEPNEGQILFNNMPLRQLDGAKMRQKIGYITQENVIFNATIRQNITLWTSHEVPEALIRDCGLEFAWDLAKGLDSQIGDRGSNLSGGQRQRICIARELFFEPSILILDEATSSLDPQNELTIQATLNRLKGTATIIVVTHKPVHLEQADRILILENGKILEQGTLESLMAVPDSKIQKYLPESGRPKT